MTSESPTHPDAPRAGGETIKALFAFASRAYALLDNVTDDDECHRDHHGNCQTHLLERECSVAAARKLLDDYSHTMDEIEAALPSLLERHRDGERRKWLATTCAAVHADEEGFYVSLRDTWSSADSFSSANEAIDAAMSAGPSPERASK